MTLTPLMLHIAPGVTLYMRDQRAWMLRIVARPGGHAETHWVELDETTSASGIGGHVLTKSEREEILALTGEPT